MHFYRLCLCHNDVVLNHVVMLKATDFNINNLSKQTSNQSAANIKLGG